MKSLFTMLARYNAWANARLYDAAERLDDADYRADLGAAFGSIHGTLNHVIVGDRVWLTRFTGQGTPPASLDATIADDRPGLRAERDRTDADYLGYVDRLSEADLAGTFAYERAGKTYAQQLAPGLLHAFNHQTHHRGQCHAMLTRLTGEAPALDLIYYQRESGEGMA